MATRLLMIGLDGADAFLLDRHSADGSLPNLARLRAKGRARRLDTPPIPSDDALWASFQYASEAGEHGRYNFCHTRPDGWISKAHWDERDHLAFWDDLSGGGMRVAIMDIPKCRNPRPINGIHLVDWLAHGRYFPKPRSQPRSLAGNIVDRFGPAPPSRCSYLQDPLSDRDVNGIVANLRDGIAMKRAAGLHYLASEDWDLFAIGFREGHCAGHAFFDFDTRHPDYDRAREARLGNPMMSILREIDGAVGDLAATAGPSAEIAVFSPTGLQPNGSLDHLMPRIVEALNERLSASNRQCSILPFNENCAALRVARQGQTPSAKTPDAQILQMIEGLLLNLRDAETGREVVSAITRPSSELEGSRSAHLPDLLINYEGGLFPRAVVSPELGCFEGESPMMRPGNHAGGGFVVAAGARVADAITDVRSMAQLGALPGTILDPKA